MDGLTPMELTRYRTLFSMYDNGSGDISLSQLSALLPHMGIFLSEEQVQGLLGALDEDGSGDLSFEEFAQLIVQQRQLMQLSLLNEDRRSFWVLKGNARLARWAIWPDGWWRAAIDSLVLLSIIVFAIDATEAWKDLLEVGDIGADSVSVRATKCIGATILGVDIVVRTQEMKLPHYSQPVGVSVPNLRTTMLQNIATHLFIIDLLAGIPLDLVFHTVGQDTLCVIFQWLRLLKLFRVGSFFRTCGRTLITPAYVVFHYTWAPLIKLAFYSFFMLHALTTAWMIGAGSPRPTYLRSISHVVQMVSGVGLTDVPEWNNQFQSVFNMILSVVQLLFVAVAIGKVAAFMQRADIKSNMQERMLETVSVLQHLGIPPHFSQEILGYQNYRLEVSHQVFEGTLQDLPEMMKDRMELYSRMKVVRNVLPSPDEVPDICLARLAQALVSFTVPPDEFVIVAGEDVKELFTLVYGMCSVHTQRGDLVAVIKRGRIFGGGGLDGALRKRASSVKSLTYCKLFRLAADAVSEVAQEFPVITEQLRRLDAAVLEHPVEISQAQSQVWCGVTGPTELSCDPAGEWANQREGAGQGWQQHVDNRPDITTPEPMQPRRTATWRSRPAQPQPQRILSWRSLKSPTSFRNATTSIAANGEPESGRRVSVRSILAQSQPSTDGCAPVDAKLTALDDIPQWMVRGPTGISAATDRERTEAARAVASPRSLPAAVQRGEEKSPRGGRRKSSAKPFHFPPPSPSKRSARSLPLSDPDGPAKSPVNRRARFTVQTEECESPPSPTDAARGGGFPGRAPPSPDADMRETDMPLPVSPRAGVRRKSTVSGRPTLKRSPTGAGRDFRWHSHGAGSGAEAGAERQLAAVSQLIKTTQQQQTALISEQTQLLRKILHNSQQVAEGMAQLLQQPTRQKSMHELMQSQSARPSNAPEWAPLSGVHPDRGLRNNGQPTAQSFSDDAPVSPLKVRSGLFGALSKQGGVCAASTAFASTSTPQLAHSGAGSKAISALATSANKLTLKTPGASAISPGSAILDVDPESPQSQGSKSCGRQSPLLGRHSQSTSFQLNS